MPVQYALSPDATGVVTNGAEKVSGNGNGARGVEDGETARLPSLDLAIMNPPFTRSVGGNLLFGSTALATDRRKMQNELSRRLGSRQASATAGLGAAFVVAAAPKLRPGEGRLALVLPATVCTGPSWQQTRSLIERDFALDMVIVSHDPTRWNFSDSTDLSEALLIATRRAKKDKAEHHTTFVNLWRNPDGILDAHRTAQAVARHRPARIEDQGTALLNVDGQHVGEMVSIPESEIAGKKWAGVQFARADVTRSALRLLNNSKVWIPGARTIADVPLCRLDEIGEIGPDVRDVRDGFEPTDSVTAYPMVESHNTDIRRRIAVAPDKWLAPLSEPRPGRPLKSIDQLWPKAGRLLLAERLRLNTARVVSMRVDQQVLSNVWWPVSIENHLWDKALAVWLNGSVGLLTLLATRNTTMGAWVRLKKSDLI